MHSHGSPSSKKLSEKTSSISSARFSRDGRYIVTRDYLQVRVWDVNMESKPLHIFPFHLWVAVIPSVPTDALL